MRTVTIRERRARLGRRHQLATPAPSVDVAATAMVALHSSDPVTVYLSARARTRGFTHEDLEDALYERRSLVRILGMRGTLFVVPADFAAVVDAACTKALARAERNRLVGMLETQGVTDDAPAWVRRVARKTVAAIGRRGEATATELTRDVPELGIKLTFGSGLWTARVGISTRMLFLLASESRVVRARPRGTWISGQYRWTRMDDWLGSALPALDAREASAELLERWLRAFGPATRTDIRWWTGWTVRRTTEALEDVGAVEVRLEDTDAIGYLLPDDLAVVRAPRRWVALLPGLDPTTMGWKERDWYLGEHAGALFDRNGNAGPTIWADGRVIGGWSQTADGAVVTRLLERVDASTVARVEKEAARLERWFDGTAITPRFKTPLQRELTERG